MDELFQDIGRVRSIAAVAFLFLLLAWESLSPFGSYFATKSGERLRHGLKNVTLGVLNALLVVFAQTLATANRQSLSVGLLPTLEDIDDAASLERQFALSTTRRDFLVR